MKQRVSAFSDTVSRRRALQIMGASLAGAATLGAVGCLDAMSSERGGDPRLTAKPGTPTKFALTGRQFVGENGFSAELYVPSSVTSATAAPLFVLLHGALRTSAFFVNGLQDVADSTGVIVFAPYSEIGTWDAITGSFGRDVKRIDAALAWLFSRWTIDPQRLVLAGFSDGGTYSLAIGRANGDLFTRVVAFSPGFLIPVTPIGQPPILITHGTDDTVLPITSTSRVIVPALRAGGYTVDYREFAGPHTVPLSVVTEVLESLEAPPG